MDLVVCAMWTAGDASPLHSFLFSNPHSLLLLSLPLSLANPAVSFAPIPPQSHSMYICSSPAVSHIAPPPESRPPAVPHHRGSAAVNVTPYTLATSTTVLHLLFYASLLRCLHPTPVHWQSLQRRVAIYRYRHSECPLSPRRLFASILNILSYC